MKSKLTLALFLAVILPALARAQSITLKLPQPSPAASVGETIGITEVKIQYHRPAVNKRKIWDGLVPYGVMWRAGANENTTISFSTPVKVEGQSLPAGTYGLFLIPGPSSWTLVLSKFAGDWGAYSYNPSEDALRATLSPQALPESCERLLFTFDDVSDSSAAVSLRWEKLRVPIRVEVDLAATVRASIQEELRGGKHWNTDSWAAAARWALRNGDLPMAQECADHALALSPTFTALRTKAAVLEKAGDAKGAAALRERARSGASEAQLIEVTAAPLIEQKKYDEAIAYLSGYAEEHPQSTELWRVYAHMGEAYSGKHDSARAHDYFQKAFAAAKDTADKGEVQDSINTIGAEAQ
jgi:tetratricopeptide (TPR) repeat protein